MQNLRVCVWETDPAVMWSKCRKAVPQARSMWGAEGVSLNPLRPVWFFLKPDSEKRSAAIGSKGCQNRRAAIYQLPRKRQVTPPVAQ